MVFVLLVSDMLFDGDSMIIICSFCFFTDYPKKHRSRLGSYQHVQSTNQCSLYPHHTKPDWWLSVDTCWTTRVQRLVLTRCLRHIVFKTSYIRLNITVNWSRKLCIYINKQIKHSNILNNKRVVDKVTIYNFKVYIIWMSFAQLFNGNLQL